MLESLRAWLNGNREYYTGVAIYSQLGTNEDLLEVLQKGPNEFRTKRLQEELLIICNELKQHTSYEKENNQSGKTNHRGSAATNQPGTSIANEELYNACKRAADQKYKEVMNNRAILFNLAVCEKWEDPNQPHKIADRVKLALDIVHGAQIYSELYDKADYVKMHGRLPEGAADQDESAYDNIQDHLVKHRLENARKALNKLKAKEPNPERIALIQKHEENIKKLENKWNSLKPK